MAMLRTVTGTTVWGVSCLACQQNWGQKRFIKKPGVRNLEKKKKAEMFLSFFVLSRLSLRFRLCVMFDPDSWRAQQPACSPVVLLPFPVKAFDTLSHRWI